MKKSWIIEYNWLGGPVEVLVYSIHCMYVCVYVYIIYIFWSEWYDIVFVQIKQNIFWGCFINKLKGFKKAKLEMHFHVIEVCISLNNDL